MDCGKTDRVVVELLSGHAEIFGTEMVAHNKYQVKLLHKNKCILAILLNGQHPFQKISAKTFFSFKEEPSLQCLPSRAAGCR